MKGDTEIKLKDLKLQEAIRDIKDVIKPLSNDDDTVKRVVDDLITIMIKSITELNNKPDRKHIEFKKIEKI